ncbi:hypothetical protein PVAP13_2NG029886 [Panicum virgatum]|uniref:Uncharacterized protein n=1 Tax=Panicum virgatum TaxID=38727 RepID=A0A8T0V4P6_PANVG|nr:hypothetical protein PVAP13_2NG029886 [Panicum virgatum]
MLNCYSNASRWPGRVQRPGRAGRGGWPAPKPPRVGLAAAAPPLLLEATARRLPAARGPRRRSPLQALPRHGLCRCSWVDTAASPKAGAHASSAAAAGRGKREQRAAAPRSGRSRGPPLLLAMEGAEEELALGVRRRSPVEEEQGRRRRSPLADGRGAGDRRGRASQRLAGGGGAGEESCVRGRSSRAGGRELQGAGAGAPRGSGSRPPSLAVSSPAPPPAHAWRRRRSRGGGGPTAERGAGGEEPSRAGRGAMRTGRCARRRGGERPVDEQGPGAHGAWDERGGAWRREPAGVAGFERGLLLLPWRTGMPARPRTSASSAPSSPRTTAASTTPVE